MTAGAAYQAHEKIYDERTGETHDYTRRKGDVETGIIAPINAPDWAYDRAKLWNAAERSENRKDAQLARSFDMSLPCVLTAEQRLELVREFARAEFADKGMVADYANHPPHKRKVKDQEESNNNWHVHIKVTLRDIGPEGFKNKNRNWNTKEQIVQWREAWATHTNRALERAGKTERVDHRSLEAQRHEAEEEAMTAVNKDVSDAWTQKAAALDRPATVHLGKAASILENRGIQTERGDFNRQVKARIIDLQERRIAATKARANKGNSSEPMSSNANGLSEALPPQPLEPKATPQPPAFEQITISDKLVKEIEGQEEMCLKLYEQERQLAKAIPDSDTVKAYHRHATDLLCPRKAEFEALAKELRQQMDKWEVANFHWHDKGDREGWELDSMKPDFLKSSDRKKWEARGKELEKIKERLTQKIDINNLRIQEVVTYLNSPQGKHTVDTTRDKLINTDYPRWHDVRNQKEQIEQQRKIIRDEIRELVKVKNDLNKYFPELSIAITSTDDIRERIKRPDILHLIRLIEQVEAKKLNRKRREEMAIR
ncbi:MAG: MobA/MobL family protein [Geobacteraceae bacterium]|nr:MobA/MobL family protein [Geobacteraceae bacterium]